MSLKPLHVQCRLAIDEPKVSADVTGCLAAMTRQEESRYCARRDYLSSPSERGEGYGIVDECCHRKMCNWCYDMVGTFGFQRETVYIAMSNLGRFLSTGVGRSFLRSRDDYRLAVTICLHVSIKTHETKFLDLSLLTELNRHRYSVAQILDIEAKILDAINWSVNPPTPMAFVRSLVSLIFSEVDHVTRNYIMELALFQTELSVLDYSTALQKASTIAIASILNALQNHLPLLSEGVFIRLKEMRLFETKSVVETRVRLSQSLAESKVMNLSPNTARPKLSRVERKETNGYLSPMCISGNVQKNSAEVSNENKMFHFLSLMKQLKYF